MLRPVSCGLLVLGALLLASPARRQHNVLTPQEQAEGWTLLFDGERVPPGAAADAVVADGVLVIGGADRVSAELASVSGSDFTLRLEYRTEGAVAPLAKVAWKKFLGAGSVSGNLGPTSRGPDDWIEIEATSRQRADGHRDVHILWRRPEDPKPKGGLFGGSTGKPSSTSFVVEVPASTRLYVRIVRALGDFRSPWLPWLVGGGVVLLLLAAAAFLWLRRRSAGAPEPPSTP